MTENNAVDITFGEFYRGLRVVVTGGHGFLGKHVFAQLKEAGSNVACPPRGSYDLREWRDVHGMLSAYRPSLVFHLAANVGGIGANVSTPAEMFYDNAAMGINMLRECSASHVTKLILVGTVCSYPKNCGIPMYESSFHDGYPEETNAAYAEAKRMLWTGAVAYRRQYGLNTIYPVLANLYGPGDDFDPNTSHVIPAIIRKVQDAKRNNEKKVKLWGNGKVTRDFLYVTEAARALLLAGMLYDKPDIVNIGTGLEYSIQEVFDQVCKAIGYEGGVEWQTDMPSGSYRRAVNTLKAGREIGFWNEVGFMDGIQRTVQWFLSGGGDVA